MKIIKYVWPSILAGSVALGAACGKKASTTTVAPTLMDTYVINHAGLYPEGIDYDTKNNVFVVGSHHKGFIGTLSADGKTFSTITNDPKLVGVLGVFTDEARDRYIALSGDIGASQKSGPNASTAGSSAYVGIYSAPDGKLLKGIDIKGLTPNAGALPNDIAVDKDGNIYITDTFSPVIYKIDGNYTASIFATNDAFKPAPGAFGLNGIVYHPDGYFIVSKTDNSKLFKVDMNNPTTVTEITGLNDAIKTPDGLELAENGNLVVIENGLSAGKAFLLSTTNQWQSASIISQETIGQNDFPTTAVSIGNKGVYVLRSKLGALLGNKPEESKFEVKKASFK